MNVKISSTALCFKITASELERLKNAETLLETLSIGRRKLSIAVDPAGVRDDFIVSYDEDTVRLLVSMAKVRELADLGRSRDGLEQDIGGLSVSLQVDFRTQKRQAA